MRCVSRRAFFDMFDDDMSARVMFMMARLSCLSARAARHRCSAHAMSMHAMLFFATRRVDTLRRRRYRLFTLLRAALLLPPLL